MTSAIVVDVPLIITTSTLVGALLAIDFALFLLYLFSRHKHFLGLGIVVFMQVLAQIVRFDPQVPQLVASDWQITDRGLLFTGLAVVFAILYNKKLLKIEQYSLVIVKVCKGLAAIGLMTVMAGLYGYPLITYLYFLIVSLLQIVLCFWARGKLIGGALWQSAGWAVAVCSFGLSIYYSRWTEAEVHTSSAVLLFVLCAVGSTAFWFIALSKQFIAERTLMLTEQQKALVEANAHETLQQQLLAVEEQAREELEAKIQERTFELEVTLRELQEANRELEEKNTQDALTGIRNRRFFDKKYLAELRRSRREQTPLSLVMMDIDHFKKVNDNYGHLAGDDVIRFVGRTIADQLKRPSDEGCRYGGEEFALILPNTDSQGAMQLAETLRHKLAHASINTDAGPLAITVSCGVYSAIGALDMPQNHYIDLADKALYQAKQSGRNRVVLYGAETDPSIT